METEKTELELAIAADPSAELDTAGLTDDERQAAENFRDEMLALDACIAKALAIDVPDLALPELPPLDHTVVDMTRSNKRRVAVPTWFAIAASVALAAFIGARVLGPAPSYPSLAAEVVAHLDHEPGALRVTDTAVEERLLASVVNSNGAHIDPGVGLITYARSCVINGKRVPHLVMQGESGPITLLLMPEEPVDGATPLSGESISGVILPVGGGSIAIVGERGVNLAEIEENVVGSISWSI